MKRAATLGEINRVFEAHRQRLGRALTFEEYQHLDAELAAVAERDQVPAGFLSVGVSEDGREVVVNHPDLQPDANGVGHLVFSPEQARAFARLLLAKAEECAPPGES
jgi:hypothetical protein